MKRKVRFSYCAVMVVAFTMLNVTAVSGQGNVNMTAGFGFPDLINAGIRYQVRQVQIGLAAGFMPVSGESVTSGSLDLYFHLLGSSELSDRRPWYVRLGLVYLHDKKEGKFNEKFIFLNTRGGREFNISENFGISLEAGVMYRLYYDVGDNTVSNIIAELSWALPSGGIGFFYRF